MRLTRYTDYAMRVLLYVGAQDTGAHASTGHPVAVVQIAFAVRPPQRGPGGGGGGGAGGAARPDTGAPPPPQNPQPLCAQVAGNLYLDDVILSVAHKYQINTDWHTRRPSL